MNILFFAPSFYQYGSIIKTGIESDGYFVRSYYYCSNWLYKLCILLGVSCLARFIKYNFFKNLKKQIIRDNQSYDTVLVIRGSEIPEWFYVFLKGKYRKARFILYLWDEISLDLGEKDILCYFNKVLSFSKVDCEKYGFLFRPMFYNDSIEFRQKDKKHDLLFIASYKPSRFYFLKDLIRYNPHLNIYAVLRCSVFTFLRNLEHIKYMKYFKFSSIPYRVMINMLNDSKACIELPNPGQYAITTRPVEAMSVNTKLITTSTAITSYDFFDEDNILIIDEKIPIINQFWLNSGFRKIPESIMKNYSLSFFVRDILS